MNKTDRFTTMCGNVAGVWFNPITGETRELSMRSNQLSYACASMLARAVSGDFEYIPKYIGFVYGAAANPSWLTPPKERNQTWDAIASNLYAENAATAGNVQISSFTRQPTIQTVPATGDEAIYTGNGVTFSAHTRSGGSDSYGFSTVNGEGYAAPLSTDHYLYHAILFSGKIQGKHIPLARVSLVGKSTEYPKKPADFELSLDWTVSFF